MPIREFIFVVMGAASADNARGGAAGRLEVNLSPRLELDVLATHAIGGGSSSLEGGLVLRGKPPRDDVPHMPIRGGFRAGGYVQRREESLTSMIFKPYTDSNVLAVYGGWGAQLYKDKVSFSFAVDVLAAPIITNGDYRNELDEPITYEDADGDSRLGWRIEMLTRFGPSRYGLGLDIQMGYRPGVDREGYTLVSLGPYLGI